MMEYSPSLVNHKNAEKESPVKKICVIKIYRNVFHVFFLVKFLLLTAFYL